MGWEGVHQIGLPTVRGCCSPWVFPRVPLLLHFQKTNTSTRQAQDSQTPTVQGRTKTKRRNETITKRPQGTKRTTTKAKEPTHENIAEQLGQKETEGAARDRLAIYKLVTILVTISPRLFLNLSVVITLQNYFETLRNVQRRGKRKMNWQGEGENERRQSQLNW